MSAISLGRTRRNAFTGALCALVVAGSGLLSGCAEDPDEGTNGVGKLPAEQIQKKARAAADAADTVRLAGDVVTNGRTYRLDMRLSGDGATGSVTTKGIAFALLRVGEHLYVKADATFWSHAADGSGDANAADKLDGKYVKVPQGDPAYQKFSGFTEKDVLLDGLLTLHGTLATAGHAEQSGTRTIRVTGGGGSGGTLDVSLEGKPYPLRLERAGDAGTLTFTSWGTPLTLTEPKNGETVDYGKQLPTS
ncbi:hypothetical protein ACIO13_13495 [Streptomyces sp. NPDC087425]|uniref:hypothetical protein n=1 Tax=unclassified Streptomyces TaxID=2593676 RepID=UPI0037F3E187